MKDEIYLSIVIPAHNESERISIILKAIEKYTKTKDFSTETIIVNNASTDNTAEVAERFRDSVPNLKIMERQSKGKGGAVHEGMLAARGEYAIFADADNSTPIEQVDKLLNYVSKYDVVIGSRYCEDGKLAVPQSFVRVIGGRVLNFVIQTFAIWGIKDTQCGFKLFSKKSIQDIFKRQTIFEFSFDIELLAIAKKLGYRIKEVGITWYDNPNSTVSPIRDGLRMIRDAWRVRKNLLAGKYSG